MVPMSYPEEITRLVAQDILFKIDHTLLSPSGGGTVYSINMISKNQNKIEELEASDGSESEGYNSDSDLDLLFDALAAVESNLPSDSPDNDELQSLDDPPPRDLLMMTSSALMRPHQLRHPVARNSKASRLKSRGFLPVSNGL